MSYICKRCMKKEVTREDGEPFVVATLENELGVCSFCEVENWVHAVAEMPELKAEKGFTPRGQGAETAREVAESIPEAKISEIDEMEAIEIVENAEIEAEDKAVEKSAVEEEITEKVILASTAEEIARLKAKLAELEKE